GGGAWGRRLPGGCDLRLHRRRGVHPGRRRRARLLHPPAPGRRHRPPARRRAPDRAEAAAGAPCPRGPCGCSGAGVRDIGPVRRRARRARLPGHVRRGPVHRQGARARHQRAGEPPRHRGGHRRPRRAHHGARGLGLAVQRRRVARRTGRRCWHRCGAAGVLRRAAPPRPGARHHAQQRRAAGQHRLRSRGLGRTARAAAMGGRRAGRRRPRAVRGGRPGARDRWV
ncbi:MAG: hypothetical protein AVDCRST_MAG08-1024, partial [uncultured Acetobacteraceae bacterium]